MHGGELDDLTEGRRRRRRSNGIPAVRPAAIFVGRSAVHGRGVFAACCFRPGQLIEACPVLVLPAGVRGESDTVLWDYTYEWSDGGAAVALGYGSLYNHAWESNARYEQDYDDELIRVYAVRPIDPGDEITINYTGEPDGRADLWFDPA